MKPSIYGLTKESLSLWMTEQEEKKFRTNQVWEWLYEKRVATFEEMTNLPKSLVTKLNESFVINPFETNRLTRSQRRHSQIFVPVTR